MHQQNEDLRAGVTVRQHEQKMLGKRAKPVLSDQDLSVASATATLIKKRRRTRVAYVRPVSLKELRAEEKRFIIKVIREKHSELAHFQSIMKAALVQAPTCTFVRLKRRRDFCDGFLVREGRCDGGFAVQRLLIEHGLHVGNPIGHVKEGHYWFQLVGQPYGIQCTHKLLVEAARELRPSTRYHHRRDSLPILAQFDATRDLRGTFYCLEDYKAKHAELCGHLEDRFGVTFTNNGNSSASCLQFVCKATSAWFELRIKVYNKLLAFLQSRTAKMQVGMNLQAIYYSDPKMFQELREACHDGLTRLEVSYYPADRQQER